MSVNVACLIVAGPCTNLMQLLLTVTHCVQSVAMRVVPYLTFSVKMYLQKVYGKVSWEAQRMGQWATVSQVRI